LAKWRVHAMQLVVAIIKHFKLDEVCQALSTLNVSGMTIMEVKGYGRQKGRTETSSGVGSTVIFLPKVRLEVAVAPDQVEKTVAAITAAARTGQIGDGKIFVTTLDHAVRIRTGEIDSDAI
jgi:nitrogen regulatory protein P-II 2